MTFRTSGFLSSELAPWAAETREQHKKWFGFAEEVNKLGMKVRHALQPASDSEQQLIGTLLFTRALQSFQAVILLAERGMIADARLLARSCAETTILLGGLATSSGFSAKLIESHYKHKLAIAQSLLADQEARLDLTLSQIANLESVVHAINTEYPNKVLREIKYEQVARDAGLLSIYNTIYRGLSGDAAHPTLDALNRHLKSDDAGNIEATVFRPERVELDDTLMAGVFGCLYCIEAIAKIFQSILFDTELSSCRGKYQQLVTAKQ